MPRKASPREADPELTPFSCVECGGALWAHVNDGVLRLRCRVGRSYSIDGLLLDKHAALDRALWAAVVALEERAELSRRIVRRLEGSGLGAQARRFQASIAAAEAQAGHYRC